MGVPRIAVLGDFMADRFIWGESARVSPEAPVPVVLSGREEMRPGGAGNVVANLRALGAEVSAFGFLGDDASGVQLRGVLQEGGANTDGIKINPARPTIQKIRVMARGQQMVRVDRERTGPASEALSQGVLDALAATPWDALVLSDYGKGSLAGGTAAAAVAEARRRDVPCLVDPAPGNLEGYAGATVATPNWAEAEACAGRALADLENLAQAAEEIRSQSTLDALLVTLGPEGMLLVREGASPFHLPTAARQVFDVTGAGDTVIAALSLALADGWDWEDAMRLSNAAAGIAVAQVGTVAVERGQVLRALTRGTAASKAPSPEEKGGLEDSLKGLRGNGGRLVFTNGCFDLLHAGHVRFLQEARSLGDALIVGVNDDASVARLKGEDRPFNALADRLEVLGALECVDLVVPFEEDTPERLIQTISPDLLVKGADWEGKEIAGASFVTEQGGAIRFLPLHEGRGTSTLAERIRGS